MSHNLSGMQADIAALVVEWGKRTIVSRVTPTLTASKRYSGTFAPVASGTYWLQPVEGTTLGGRTGVYRAVQGAIDETTHILITRKTDDIRAGDRLLPSGETYFYDVLETQEDPTHNTVKLRRVKQS